MSQNLSKMTDIYIPELMELDSYWQKAVEDAICDTLKGEKRLDYALRNRKKIKEKLEKVGYSRYNMSSQEDKESLDSLSGTSECETRKAFLERKASRSREKTPIEKRPKSPDRPLLGNGSLEKMKKSQNSFNCEPMGVDTQEELSGSETSEAESDEVRMKGGRSKKVEWLHVRKGSDFDCSDSESANNMRGNVGVVKDDFCKSETLKDKNYFIRRKQSFGSSQHSKQRTIKQTAKDVPWETDSEDDVLRNSDLDRKLHLALAKREILNENLEATSLGNVGAEIAVGGSAPEVGGGRKGKDLLSPFVRFYLEVYRELCHKFSVKHIAEEAARRWWGLTGEEKSVFGSATATE